MNLIELTHEAKQIYDYLTDMGMDEQVIQDTIEAETDLIPKMESYGHVIRRFETEDAMLEAEIKRLTEIRRTRNNRMKHLKDRLLTAMIETGTKKIDHPLFSISVRNNPESVDVYEECLIPKEFMRIKHEVNKTEIKKALQGGRDVQGCRLTRTQSLSFK